VYIEIIQVMGSFKKLLILGNSMHHLTLNAYINVECLRSYRMMVLVKINTYCMNRFVFLLSSPEVLKKLVSVPLGINSVFFYRICCAENPCHM